MIRFTLLMIPLSLFLLLTAPSCPTAQPTGPAATAPDRSDAKAPQQAPRQRASHALHSDRLRTIMTGLGTQVAKRWPQEMEPPADSHDEARFREASELASGLAEAAARIPDAVSGVAMSEQDRRVFMSNVEQLQSSARRLQASAAAHDRRGMQSALRRIQTTCNGCHERFREIAGPIRFGR